MTLGAICAILSVVLILVTGNTLGWCTFINAIAMTFLAFQVSMFSCQWKSGLIMIERRVPPATRTMTRLATGAKLAVMFIVIGMTGKAVLGCAFIPIRMTGRTLYAGVFPCQREPRIVVIEGHLAPCGGLMTGAAVRPKLTVVDIARRVAGETILGCTFVNTVLVACLAGRIGMTAR